MAIALVPEEIPASLPANDNRSAPIAGGPGFEYQTPMVEAAVAAIRRGEREVLIAATPGAGKTVMAFEIARRLIEAGDIDKALVMAWWRISLRDQWVREMGKKAPGLSDHVRIEIPQRGHNIRGKFDLLIQDEAHQGYEVENGKVSDIKSSVKAKTTLILTGSPSVFIKRGLKPTAVFSMEELHAAGRASDLTIEVGTSAYNILEDDFNRVGDVTEEGKKAQTQAATTKTLDNLLKDLHKRIRLGSRDMAKGVVGWWNRMQFGSAKKGWNAILAGLQKTIVACNDIDQAEQVAKYFRAARVETLVSHGGNKRFPAPDKKSGNIELFETSHHPLLVVVDRAQLGYDNPELVNFIDMTGSRNPDRIFQMLCRVVRPSKKDPMMKKLFIKVMPASFSDSNLLFFMEGVLNLSRREIFETYDGTGIYKGPVPARERKSRRAAGEGRKESKEQDIVWSPVLEPGMSLFGPSGYFETIAHTNAEGYEPIGQVRLGDLLGHKVDDPEGVQQEIIDWHLAHKTDAWPWPKATGPESRLGNALCHYAQSDADFAQKVRDLGWRSLSERTKDTEDAVVTWRVRRQEWPNPKSNDPEERRLGIALRNRAIKNPEFLERVKAIGYLRLADRVQLIKQEFIQFFKTHGRWPASSKGTKEYLLANKVRWYFQPGTNRHDPSFEAEIRALGWRPQTEAVEATATGALEWCRSNKRRPSQTSDDPVEVRYARFISNSERSTNKNLRQFFATLNELDLPNGHTLQRLRRQKTIVDFFLKNKRWPRQESKQTDEARLGASFYHYTSRAKTMSFDPAFHAECAKLDPERFGDK